jgi:predicted naringenin-chalcone synthase
MSYNSLLHIETIIPEYSFNEKEMLQAYIDWVELSGDKKIIEKSKNIFQNTGIKRKNSILPNKEAIFAKRTFDESNALYRKEAVRYAIEIVHKTLEKSKIKAKEIDFLVTTSCTGLMSPSINAYLINHFRMRNDVVQIPVAQVGCSGGTSGIIYLNHLLKSKPNSKAMMLNLEFNTNTMQKDNYNLDNIIGTAIFSDGIACSVFENSKQKKSINIFDVFSHHFYDSENILRYDLGSSGFTLKMSKELPIFVAKNYLKNANNFLKKHNLSVEDIDHFLVHPGGIRILESIEKIIAQFGKNLSSSLKVMKNYGNMSSATIMFIMEELISKKKIKNNQKILMTSFGPGFVANFILFEV